MATRYIGTVKAWKDDRGFGFIIPDDKNLPENIFTHVRDLVDRARDGLKPAERVEFEMGAGRDGRPQATSVNVIRSAEDA